MDDFYCYDDANGGYAAATGKMFIDDKSVTFYLSVYGSSYDVVIDEIAQPKVHGDIDNLTLSGHTADDQGIMYNFGNKLPSGDILYKLLNKFEEYSRKSLIFPQSKQIEPTELHDKDEWEGPEGPIVWRILNGEKFFVRRSVVTNSVPELSKRVVKGKRSIREIFGKDISSGNISDIEESYMLGEAKNKKRVKSPWAVCTASVGREDKAKYER